MALVIALAMVVAMALPAMAVPPTEDSTGTITVNSPIMGAQYFAYQIFKMTMDDDTDPTAFSYSISKDDPFFAAVWDYTSQGTKHLILTGVESTKLATPVGDVEYSEYTVTAAEDFKDDSTANGVQEFGKAMQTAYNNMTAEQKALVTEYKPTYEADKDEVTMATATAITFENLPYGYYLITNNYDDPAGRKEVILEYGTEGETGHFKAVLTKESTEAQIETAAQGYAQAKYPDLDAAKTYVEANSASFEKTWNDMSNNERQKVLDDLQASTKADAIAKVNAAIAAAASDDNATDGTTKARLIFIDSTTPNGVINEKNEIEKWDVPVNPDGHADLPNIPEHDEPKGGKNIIVGYKGDEPIYADTAEFAIGDDVHYQLSINAVNFERTDGNKPESVKQIKEYVIADYQNKNMVFKESEGLKVTIVKKDKDGNEAAQKVAGPFDYTEWVKKGYFFTNKDLVDLGSGEVFGEDAGGIVIPWVEKVTEKTEGFDSMKNLTKNTVFKPDTSVAAKDELADSDKEEEWFKNNEDGKFYKKIPVPFEVPAGEINVGDKIIINGTAYDVEAGPKVTIDGTAYTINTESHYLLDANGNKLQAKTNDGELIWETEDVYFHSLYPDDVTILVDYTMTLTDTATIDGEGNKNFSQFGVDYVEEGDRDYEYNSGHTPQDNPPDKPKQPTEKKEKDDATVFTYAVAIKKVDEDGEALVGAEFQIRGVKKVTQMSDGWYKVEKYDHTDDKYYQEANLKTDKNGILVVDGFQTKWVLDVLETKAPDGYNRLTQPVKVQPVKTGTDATDTTTTITYDENGVVTSTTTETVYKKDDAVIGKTVKVNNKITYYDSSNNVLADKAAFDALFADNTDLLNPDKAKEAVVTKTSAAIAELEVINQKGTELPSTGGIGTTIFYVVGAILVIGAGVILITRRRMDG